MVQAALRAAGGALTSCDVTTVDTNRAEINGHDTAWRPGVTGGGPPPPYALAPNPDRSGWATLGFVDPGTGLGDFTIITTYDLKGNRAVPQSTPEWSVAVDGSGKITIGAQGTAFVLKFSTGANAATSARDVLGFGAVDTASGQSATAREPDPERLVRPGSGRR